MKYLIKKNMATKRSTRFSKRDSNPLCQDFWANFKYLYLGSLHFYLSILTVHLFNKFYYKKIGFRIGK